MTQNARFITAIGPALNENEELHEEGLRIEQDDQWSKGFEGILIAGTMGQCSYLAR